MIKIDMSTRFEELEAKYMFEELGYKQSFFGNKDNKCIIYNIENENTYIMFKPSTKEIKFCGSFKNKVDIVNFSMDTNLLQAINKQVEELGWNIKIIEENKEIEIDRLTAESTEWESKFYNEVKKVDKAIEYIYLHSTQRKWFADISDRLHNQEIRFKGRIEDLLDILKGVDKE